uniref:Uncharacterized protein n=1 Tax=Spilarctia obliqua nucleopolyhedrovirus TaxID=1638618 RepID=A0A7G9U8E2_9ABAC|nr:hypothetical protein [Spilarctia obliqua nucleopolyhedrovirus]
MLQSRIAQIRRGRKRLQRSVSQLRKHLCQRVSFQTLLLASAILLLLFNVENFSALNLFVILLILLALFCHNNYIISNPQIVFCKHKNTLKNHE